MEPPDIVEKEVVEEITVCQNHFCEPKILLCMAPLLLAGVHPQLAIQAMPNRHIVCPECRKEPVLPHDPDQLPTAFLVTQMKELHTEWR